MPLSQFSSECTGPLRLRSMRFRPSAARRRVGGFTLLEVLVASGITMVLLALLIRISGGIIDNSRLIRRGSEAGREASLALDLMTADFEAMLIQQQEGSSLRVEMEEIHGVMMPWASLLSSAPDADGGAYPLVPRAISFRVGYKDPVPGSAANPRFGLYRKAASASATFAKALAAVNPQDDFWSADGGIGTTDWQDLLADHLYEMQVRLQPVEGGSWIELKALGDTLRLDRNGVYLAASGQAEVLVSKGIGAIEISLVLLDKDADKRVQQGIQSRSAVLKQYGYHFVRRTALLPRGTGRQ